MSQIGMFTYSTEPRGSVVHAACLAEALCEQGHDVTVFALSKNRAGFFRDLYRSRICLIPALTAPAEMDALIAQRIAEFVAGLDAMNPRLDILHAQDCLAASALLEARQQPGLALGGCPLVRTVHHVEHFASPYLEQCQRRSILEADCVLSVSEVTAEDVYRHFGRVSERVTNGVVLERFDPAVAGAKRELRQALGLEPTSFVALSLGGVEQRKNSLRCLDAFARLAASEPRAEWVVIGGASVLDHRAYVQEWQARLLALPPNVQRRIHRLGTLSDPELTRWYQASDVLLCPSEQEGWGLSVLEAMAARLPVIVPRQAPFTEYVPDEAAVFVDPFDAGDITRALRLLADDPATRQRLGEHGRRVAEHFSWSRSAEAHSKSYERALEGNERRRSPAPHGG